MSTRPTEPQAGPLSELSTGEVAAGIMALGLLSVAALPAAIGVLIVVVMRALGARARWLLVVLAAGLVWLLAAGSGQAIAGYRSEGVSWRIAALYAREGVIGTLVVLGPVALPLGALIGLLVLGWCEWRRPFWVRRSGREGMLGRLGARRDRRRLGRGTLDGRGGVALGVGERGRVVRLSADELGEHALILGPTGSGKTHSLLVVVEGLLGARRRTGLVVIDCKGDPDLVHSLRALAETSGREFAVWRFGGVTCWNPLARGDATELRDKLIALEEWSEPHYQRAAQRYLQIAIGALRTAGRSVDLATVTAMLAPQALAALVTETPGFPTGERERIRQYLQGLDRGALSAAAGLANRLALLSEGEAGPALGAGEDAIDLRRALGRGDIVVFSLDGQRYGEAAAQLARMVASDLKTVAGERLAAGETGAGLVVIDEFSAMGGDHVLPLFARARSAGLGVILVTQELADLVRVDPAFCDQVLGNTNVKIVHRQNVPESAERIAGIAGTEAGFQETFQTERSEMGALGGRRIGGWRGQVTGRGTIREVERYRVHPNELKALGRGQVVLLVSQPEARLERVAVTGRRPLAAPAPAVARVGPDVRQPTNPASAASGPAGAPLTRAPEPDLELLGGDEEHDYEEALAALRAEGWGPASADPVPDPVLNREIPDEPTSAPATPARVRVGAGAPLIRPRPGFEEVLSDDF